MLSDKSLIPTVKIKWRLPTIKLHKSSWTELTEISPDPGRYARNLTWAYCHLDFSPFQDGVVCISVITKTP